MNCGLLGEKLGHSYSPAIHAMLAATTTAFTKSLPASLRISSSAAAGTV